MKRSGWLLAFLAFSVYGQDKLVSGPGSTLTETKCKICHELEHIRRTPLSRGEWTDNLRNMRERGTPMDDAGAIKTRSELGESCQTRADCLAPLACIENTCLMGFAPDSGVQATAPTRGKRGESCDASNDCEVGLACIGGRCLESESLFSEALAHYEESIAYQPTIEAYQRSAALLIRQKKDQQAAELMERALSLKELSPRLRLEIHKACGNCWLRSERPNEAEAHYLKALELDPRSDAVLSNLGSLCLQKGDLGRARKYFQDALALQPRSDKALAGLRA